MEETLEVYHRPYAPTHPLVCMDESSKQQVKDTREPLPGQPGKPQRYDDAYECNGVSNLCMIFAPLAGWRQVKVTERRTNVDWAPCLKDLVDGHFPEAEKITLMSENLNTHKLAALYEAFSPQEARRIIEKLAWHHTPKHGSWLNMAEIELSVLQRQFSIAVSGSGDGNAGGGGVGAQAQPRRGESQLALYNRRCTDQVEKALSFVLVVGKD